MGVVGIEAEAVMLGQPLYMLMPEVVGFENHWQVACWGDSDRSGVDRDRNPAQGKVVGKFVEFYGPGVSQMALADRATIATWQPEYGATMAFSLSIKRPQLYEGHRSHRCRSRTGRTLN